MPRDYKQLRVFHLSHELVKEVYRATKTFPKDEMYGLTSQMRRSAVSVPANIVEGCSRNSMKDYRHFLTISLGSAMELCYYFQLSYELGYLKESDFVALNDSAQKTARSLNALISSVKKRSS